MMGHNICYKEFIGKLSILPLLICSTDQGHTPFRDTSVLSNDSHLYCVSLVIRWWVFSSETILKT